MARSLFVSTSVAFALLVSGCRAGGEGASDGGSGEADAQSIISANSDDRPKLSLDNLRRFNPIVVRRDPAKQLKYYYVDKAKTSLVVEAYEKAIVRDAPAGTNRRVGVACVIGAKDAASAFSWLQSKKAFLTTTPLGAACPR